MAVEFDAVGPSSAGATADATNTVSWSHTSTGSDRLLLVGVAVGQMASGSITTSATYNSVAMTSVQKRYSNDQTDGYLELFRLIAPATGANTVQVTASASVSKWTGGSVSFTGADQTTPLGTPASAVGSSAAPSVAVTGTTAGNMVADLVCSGNSITSSNQTVQWSRNNDGLSGAGNGAMSTAAAGGSVTMSYIVTTDWWAIAAVEVLAVAAAADSLRLPIQTIRVP